jgi:hypothetical protein
VGPVKSVALPSELVKVEGFIIIGPVGPTLPVKPVAPVFVAEPETPCGPVGPSTAALTFPTPGIYRYSGGPEVKIRDDIIEKMIRLVWMPEEISRYDSELNKVLYLFTLK